MKTVNKKRVVFVILILVLLMACFAGYQILQKPTGLVIPENDGTVMDGSLTTDDPEELLKMLQEKVDASQFSFQINSYPHFPKGSDCPGNIRIENPPENLYNTTVEIILEDGETVYKSPMMKPGQYIEKAPLFVKLPKGEHEASAVFKAYHDSTNSYMGQVIVGITIYCTK